MSESGHYVEMLPYGSSILVRVFKDDAVAGDAAVFTFDLFGELRREMQDVSELGGSGLPAPGYQALWHLWSQLFAHFAAEIDLVNAAVLASKDTPHAR